MIVELYDHPARFLVSSDSDETRKHLVDLLENERDGVFHGKCQCEQHQYRLQPLFDTGGTPGRCKHMVAAREMFVDLMLKTVHKATTTPRHHDDGTA